MRTASLSSMFLQALISRAKSDIFTDIRYFGAFYHTKNAGGTTVTRNSIHTADGLSTGKNTDHVSLRFVQSNLQRSKLATSELLVEADKRKIAVALVQEPYVGDIGELRRYFGCRVFQRMTPPIGLVKAAIVILDNNVVVEEDTHRRKRHSCFDQRRELQNWRCVCVSRMRQAYRPIPRPQLLRYGGASRTQRKEHPDVRNYRGGRLFQSAVNVTACSSARLDRAEKWQVVRSVTSSDHNAVTFEIRTGGRPGPGPFRGTRIYNTAKVRWSEFLIAFDNAKEELALTAEMVESVDSCD
ncbi:hypothetical protein EVAR_9944_1 [Eumeta japonica]|uniref:Endonuclease/exonuclease/phosphatase domain-containing protein n=1 Tax=Eumeta variegata TaxID=151549 RepID=A0A4C1TQT8_EUMVA|nr:hypothetical protein EVAR_9944_1 [Eumeta japonica]